jgi:hypothetical protein
LVAPPAQQFDGGVIGWLRRQPHNLNLLSWAKAGASWMPVLGSRLLNLYRWSAHSMSA